jgi:hypothetical protein
MTFGEVKNYIIFGGQRQAAENREFSEVDVKTKICFLCFSFDSQMP